MRVLTLITLFLTCSLQSYAFEEITLEQYIEKYKAVAISEMEENRIPASITLAQGILESRFGNSYLARQANNHFGIKCHTWTGKKVYRDDDKKNECFRKYGHALQSYRDHSDFLQKPRYAFLYDLEMTDYVSWAYGLKEAGYATDSKYADRLVDLIERYELYQYDQVNTAPMVASTGNAVDTYDSGSAEPSIAAPAVSSTYKTASATTSVTQSRKVNTAGGYSSSSSSSNVKQETGIKRRVTKWLNRNNEKVDIPPVTPGTRTRILQSETFYYNRIKTIITTEDCTPMQIARTYNISVTRLCQYNEFDGNIEIPAHAKIYLEPKRNVGPVTDESIRVQEGQSMESISQAYGVKLKSLYKRNKMRIGTQPAAGEVIYLRGKNPRVPKTIQKESLAFNNNRFFHTPGNRSSDRKKEITNTTTYDIPEPAAPSMSTPMVETPKVVTPTEPVYTEPVYSEPVNTTPVYTEPVYTEPVYTAPIVAEPTIEYTPPVVESPNRIVVGSFDDEPNYSTGSVQSENRIVTGSLDDEPSYNAGGEVIRNSNSNRIVTGSFDEPERRIVTGSLDDEPYSSPSKTVTRYKIYEVQPKDTLWALSRKFNISIEELKRINNLTSNSLAIGQELKHP